MSIPLIEYPRGITAALGVRDAGQLPRELAGVIAGTIDLLEPYLFTRREFVVQAGIPATLTPGGITGMPALVVPNGECWYVWAWQVSASTAVGEALTVYPALRLQGGSITAGGPTVLGASTVAWAPPNLYPGRFFLAPGESLGAATGSATGAPNVAGAAAITRLRV